VDLHATKYSVSEQIATITLNRPQRMNAWTGRMHTEYRWLLAQAEADPEVRVIVVTGEGRAFCAGADSAALKGTPPPAATTPASARSWHARDGASGRSSTIPMPSTSG